MLKENNYILKKLLCFQKITTTDIVKIDSEAGPGQGSRRSQETSCYNKG